MLSKLIIEKVIESQKERLNFIDSGLPRKIANTTSLSSHALIVSGIRRCGKSTLLQQIHKEYSNESIYLNFEDPRLAGFDLSDSNRLHEITTKEKNQFISSMKYRILINGKVLSGFGLMRAAGFLLQVLMHRCSVKSWGLNLPEGIFHRNFPRFRITNTWNLPISL